MPTVTMKISVEEEEVILRRMSSKGETNKSAHIKRIYFAGNDDSSELAGKLDELATASREVQSLLQQLIELQATPIGTTLAAAILLLLFPSVQPPIQAKVSKYIDMKGVEAILQAGAK